MKRRQANIRISVRREDGKTRKLELFRTLLPGRYKVKLDGKLSDKVETTTITEITHRLREWLAK